MEVEPTHTQWENRSLSDWCTSLRAEEERESLRRHIPLSLMDGYIIRNRPLLLSRTSALIAHTEREEKRNRKANRDRREKRERENSKTDRGERGVRWKIL